MMDVDTQTLAEIRSHLDNIRIRINSAVDELNSYSNQSREELSGNTIDRIMSVKDEDIKVLKEACNRISATVEFIDKLEDQVYLYLKTAMD